VLDGVYPQGIDTHVEITVDVADDVRFDVLPLGGEVDAVAGEVLVLQWVGALPIPTADESLLVIPLGLEGIGVDAEEAAGVIAGLGVDRGFGAFRVSGMALPIPRRGDRVVDVVPVRPGVVAQVALIGGHGRPGPVPSHGGRSPG